jgi:hypothetical protein
VDVLNEGASGRVPATTTSDSPRPTNTPPSRIKSPAPAAGTVRALVQGAFDAERRLDVALAAAARGKSFSPGELLALQTAAFRYSQTVEIVSRAADRLVGAIKQTLGTQV